MTTLEPWRESHGTLIAELLTIDSLAGREQRLVIAAVTTDGRVLSEDDPEKLLRLPVREIKPPESAPAADEILDSDLETRRNRLAEQINRRNLAYFEQEVDKLDAWTDDLKVGLEQEIKEVDRRIQEVRRTASTAPTLDEKLHWQRQQRDLEQRRTRLRRELFDRQDEVDAERNRLIDELETRLRQKAESLCLFVIDWVLP